MNVSNPAITEQWRTIWDLIVNLVSLAPFLKIIGTISRMLSYCYREGHFSQDMSWTIIVVYFKEGSYRANSSGKSEELNIKMILVGGSINIGTRGPWSLLSCYIPMALGQIIFSCAFIFSSRNKEKQDSLKKLFVINHEVKPSMVSTWRGRRMGKLSWPSSWFTKAESVWEFRSMVR